MKQKIVNIAAALSLATLITGCANYGTGYGGAITGTDVRNCGIGAAVGLILSNQVSDLRRSSNKNEWKLASAIAGCAAAPWATRQFESTMRGAVHTAAQTGQQQQIRWDDPYSKQQYQAVAAPTRTGSLDGKRCQEVQVSGVNAPDSFAKRTMSLCDKGDGTYEIVNIY